MPKIEKQDAEWREQLDEIQYHVTREKGTERAFTGIYWDCHDQGTYRCICCGAPLFSSAAKFDSGCGWPSFHSPNDEKLIDEHVDRSFGMRRTEVTNDPGGISRQIQMTSINAALQVDLYDQANAAFVNGQPYSGFGGSTDFIVGALHSKGGASFMALPSWHEKSGSSNIVPRLTETVTSFQHSYVVTEQGVAECFGRTATEQATNLIERAAHPDARESLRGYLANWG